MFDEVSDWDKAGVTGNSLTCGCSSKDDVMIVNQIVSKSSSTVRSNSDGYSRFNCSINSVNLDMIFTHCYHLQIQK